MGLQDGQLSARQSRELSAFGQQDMFFQLSALKATRMQRLKHVFESNPPRRLLLGPRIANLDPVIEGWQVEGLPEGFFEASDPVQLNERCHHLGDAVVVVNNNDLGRTVSQPMLCDFYARCERTLFIGWDWDNHHWLDRSTVLAAHTDLYAPGHQENLYLLTRYNASTIGPVYCASVQWSRQILCGRVPMLLEQERSDAPLGMHIPYSQFSYRSRVVSTLSQQFPQVGFSAPSFHSRTEDQRLLEWASHKAHWIVPVLNDVPIRIFDALITGGIPLVPQSLRHLAPANNIDRAHIVFYTPNDIIEPQAVVARANALFDHGGADGMMYRHRYALDHHHGTTRLQQMLGFAADEFGWVRP